MRKASSAHCRRVRQRVAVRRRSIVHVARCHLNKSVNVCGAWSTGLGCHPPATAPGRGQDGFHAPGSVRRCCMRSPAASQPRKRKRPKSSATSILHPAAIVCLARQAVAAGRQAPRGGWADLCKWLCSGTAAAAAAVGASVRVRHGQNDGRSQYYYHQAAAAARTTSLAHHGTSGLQCYAASVCTRNNTKQAASAHKKQ